ncbi:MAG: leucine-rich repeat protein [Bacillales bacterium]|nr:leucine-rich repeat protein [Bacillales bacterium]
MTKFKKTMLATTLVVTMGLTGCSLSNKSDKNDENVGTSGQLKVLNANVDVEQINRLDQIKAEYLIENKGYLDTDKVDVIIELDESSLIDRYLDSSTNYNSVSDYVNEEEGIISSKAISSEQKKLINKLSKEKLIDNVDYQYQTILNGFSCTTTYGNIKKLEKYSGIKNVILQDTYNLPMSTSNDTNAPVQNVVDVYETGIFNSSTVNYDGEGTAVAILDSGFDCSHEVFRNQPNSGVLNQQKIGEILDESNAKKTTKDLKVSDVYYSKKIPFVYDYADKDSDVTPYDSEHGTHVAGIIGGKSDTITGVAINTQLVLLKVFPNLDSGAKTNDILAALEDAVLLKVDAINMSLGSSCGFSREEDGNAINTVYDKINASGINLITAASNSYNSSYGSEQGNTNKVTNPDSATVGSPSTYEAALSVSSISGTKSKYIIGNDKQVIFFNESNNLASKPYDFFEMLGLPQTGEKVYDYVTVPGVGMKINYAGLDIKGKIALVRRGDNTFEEKAKVASSQGAAGIIIYNNVAGDILMNMGKDLDIPCISISKDNGTELAKKSSGKLTMSRENLAGPFMSDFSSWGPTPDLKLKPEITAHGGNIKSSIPGGGYDELSGTSMASPNLCGIVVLIRDYVKNKYPDLSAKQVSVMVNQLLMSTATIALNEEGVPYSPRKQGAGLASLFNAVNSDAYITVDGIDRSKLELGDDPKKTGIYEMSFNIVNTSNNPLSYKFDLCAMTETVSSSDKNFLAEKDQILKGNVEINSVTNATLKDDIITVEGNKTSKVKVTYTLSNEDKLMMNKLFPYGEFVEGYVKLLSLDNTDKGVDLSVPFLAFYGDWNQAPMFDKTYYEVESEAHDGSIDEEDKIKADVYATTPYASYLNNYIVPIGSYLYDIDESLYDAIPASEEHAAISSQFGSTEGISCIYAGLLRGAKQMTFTITDKVTGEVVYTHVDYNANKSYSLGGSPNPYYEDIAFKTADLGLINNREYEFKMEGVLDYGDGGKYTNVRNTFEFTFTCDDQAPVISNARFEKKYDKTLKKDRYYVYLDVYDNHYVQAITPVSFSSSSSYTLLTENPIPVYGERNSTTEVKFEITDYIDNLYNDAICTNTLAFLVDDYALNSNLFLVELPGTDGDFKFTQNGEYDGQVVNAITVYVDEATDLVPYLASNDENLDSDKSYLKYLNWTSSNEKIAVVNQGVIQPLKTGRVQVTVSEGVEGRKTSVIVNIKEKAKSVSLTSKKNAISNDEVELENLEFTYFKTIQAFLSSGDKSEIGSTGSINYFSASPTVNFYPGERIQIFYSITPWYLPEERYELYWESSNPEVARVDQYGNVEAMKKGSAIIYLSIKVDGKTSNIMASCRLNVKSEFVIENRTLIAYKGRGGDVVIPDDEGILYIGSFSFCLYELDNTIKVDEDDYDANKIPSSNLTVTSVVVPSGVEEIQKYAFYNCTGLEKVTLPDSIKYVREFAFYGDKKLSSINLEKVNVIGARTFYNCESLDNISLSNIYAIGVRAFEGCTSLTSIDLSTLRNTGREAFKGCKNLKNVVLSDDTKLSYGMFVNCGIEELSLGVDRIPEFAFANNYSLKTVTINNDLVSIGEGAFSGDKVLTKVEFKGNLEWMEDQVFYNCISLESITLPNCSVKYGSYVFYNCSSLKTVSFQENSYIESLGGSLFEDTIVDKFIADSSNYYSTSSDGSLLLSKDGKSLVLASVNYQYDEVLQLGYDVICQGAFSGVKSLKTVEFTSSNTVVDDYAFANCSSLEKVIFPSGGLSIGMFSFAYTNNLTSCENIDKLDEIGQYAFTSSGLLDVNFKDGVKILEGAFLSSSLETITFNGNASIELGAFQKCESLTTVNMPTNGKVEIGKSSFANSTKLKNIDLTKAGETIGDNAFLGCTSLAQANLTNVKYIGSYAFADCSTLNTLSMPAVVSIGEGAFSRVTQSGSAPAFSSLVLPDSLVSIGLGAFMGCSGFNQVRIPEGIQEIPDYAFSYCLGLEKVVLPESCASIGEYAFGGCSLLNSINTSGIEVFKESSFLATKALKDISFNSAIRIEDNAFLNSRIENIGDTSHIKYIGEYAFQANYFKYFDATSVESIGECAFNSNQQLTKIIFSSSLKSVGKANFLGCSNLEEFLYVNEGKELNEGKLNDSIFLHKGSIYNYLPNGEIQLNSYPGGNKNSTFEVLEGTIRIEEYAGNMNMYLKKLILPDSLKTIGNFAFNGCRSLEEVEFRSYLAPTLESSYGIYNVEDPSLSENDPGYNILFKYLDLFGATNFYAQFIDIVGKNNPLKMTLPSNSILVGYDSLIYEAYFGKVENSNRSSYVARDEYTVNFLDAFKKVPSDVNLITLSDEKTISSALTSLNSLKQDLTNYGYTKEEIEQMREIVLNANKRIKEIKLLNASKEIKDIQEAIDNLPNYFAPSMLEELNQLSLKISRLDIDDKLILDLTKYNGLLDSYQEYVSSLQGDIEEANKIADKGYVYPIAIALLSLSLLSLGWIIKKFVF